ncbi:hypothetical protein CHS0354_039857 [Potamilus streckersoni]|uniref:Mitochondria-eating protein n=1 Tax=Potamilus streckersoni TaxID=2493646 RepID=A0AAE0SRS2_9BIVA|nr:hypothetical protein CHS0354_039857 [Potamilus streckersoni]
MPLCGLKKSKNRDSSPPYTTDLQELQKFKDRVQRLEKALEDAKEQKDQLEQECSDLRRRLEEAREDTLMSEIPLGVEQNIKRGFQAEFSETQDKIESYTDKIDELQLQIDKMEEKGKITEDMLDKEKAFKEKTEKEVKRLQKILEEKENALKEAHQELQNRTSGAVPKSPVRDVPSEWKAKLEAANQELTKERGECMNKEREISRLASEKAQIQLETDRLKERIKELESRKTAGEDELNKAKDTTQNNLRNQVKNLEEIVASYKQKLEDEKLAKDNALCRLAEAGSMQLLLHSTDASEESEANRKLADQFTKLYKNEWVFALQNLQKIDKSDDEAIKILQDILVECYKYCQDSAETQLNRIEENMFLPPMVTSPKSPEHCNDSEPLSPVTPKQQQTSSSKIPRFNALQKQKAPSSDKKESQGSTNGHSKFSFKSKKGLKGSFVRVKGEKCPDIPAEVMKGIKGYRKRVAKQVVSIVQEELNQKLQQIPDLGDQVLSACAEYINQCCEICWNLCVQDPPCHLSWDIPFDRTFNTDIYTVYTHAGSHIDFVVWPTLYSGNGRLILAKGIAQGDGS